MNLITTMLAPLIAQLLPLLGALMLGVGSWAAKRAADWLKLSNDARVREYLNEAIENGVAWAEAEMTRRLLSLASAGQPAPAASPGDWHIAAQDAAGYVAARVPDALRHFGVTPGGLEQIVKTRLSGV